MPQRTAFNEDGPSDGEAYFKIRYYQFQRDTKSEARWKACLRGSRLKNLNQLLRDKELTAGFDALLDIPGVWDGMRLTTLPRVMAMGCKDVSKPTPSTARTTHCTTGMFELPSPYQGGAY